MNEVPPHYGWTQPICESCFKIVFAGRSCRRLIVPEPEICVYCGLPATTGIYIRINPSEAYHPSLMKD